MVWFLGIWEQGPLFNWQDKSGLCADKETPLPFFKWAPSPKVTDNANIPTVAKYYDGDGRIPDAFWVQDASVVSGRFKTVVEEFEPDVHQFFPIILLDKDGKECPGDFFIFHPTRYAPCVLLSKCNIYSRVTVKYGARAGLPIDHVHDDEFVISRPAYGVRKIFGSLFLPGGSGLFVTDEVMARMKAESLLHIRSYPVKELDEPWIFEKEAPDLSAFLTARPDIASTYKLEAF